MILRICSNVNKFSPHPFEWALLMMPQPIVTCNTLDDIKYHHTYKRGHKTRRAVMIK